MSQRRLRRVSCLPRILAAPVVGAANRMRSPRTEQTLARRKQRLGYVRGGAVYPLLKGERTSGRTSGTCKAVLFAWRVVAALAPHVLVEIGLPDL